MLLFANEIPVLLQAALPHLQNKLSFGYYVESVPSAYHKTIYTVHVENIEMETCSHFENIKCLTKADYVLDFRYAHIYKIYMAIYSC